MKGVKENLQTLGFDDVISKPVDKMLLHRYLATVINSNVQTKSKENDLSSIIQTTNQDKYFMLVEDDIDAAEITKLLLESMGVIVDVAHSAQACRQLLHTRPKWHKILLDVHLPDENGLVLAKYITSQGNTTEIVIISGAEIGEAEIKSSGSSRALMKPLNKQKLQDLIA